MPAKIIAGDAQSEFWFDEGCHIIEVSNHSDDPQLSIARARVAPGRRTKWHRLHDVQERYLIVRGTGIVEIGELAPTPVTEGAVVIIPAGTRQRIHNTGNTDLVFYALCSPRFTAACYEALEDADS